MAGATRGAVPARARNGGWNKGGESRDQGDSFRRLTLGEGDGAGRNARNELLVRTAQRAVPTKMDGTGGGSSTLS
jgi:hypothetical protein